MAVMYGSWSASVGSVGSTEVPGAGNRSERPVSYCEATVTLAAGTATVVTPLISGIIKSFEMVTVGTALAGTITITANTDLGSQLYTKAAQDPDTALKIGADADFTTRDVCSPVTLVLLSSDTAGDATKQIKLRVYASRSA